MMGHGHDKHISGPLNSAEFLGFVFWLKGIVPGWFPNVKKLVRNDMWKYHAQVSKIR